MEGKADDNASMNARWAPMFLAQDGGVATGSIEKVRTGGDQPEPKALTAETGATKPAAPWTGTSVPPWGLWLAGIIGVACIAYSFIRKARRLRQDDTLIISEQQARFEANRQQTRPEHTKTAASGGLEGATREVIRELDAKAAKLQELIAAADRRIAELRVLASTGPSPARGDGNGPAIPARERPRREPAFALDPADGDGNAGNRIIELADQGLSPAEIAAITGHSVSEINLTLALRG